MGCGGWVVEMKRDETIKETLCREQKALGKSSSRTWGRAKYQEPIQALACHRDTVLSEKRANQTIGPVRRGLTQIVKVDGWRGSILAHS